MNQLKYSHKLTAFLVLLLLPLMLQPMGAHWVRIADTCLLYIMLALGMNIIVGYAGLLDLGYVAFYMVGAYLMALLTSPHLTENFMWLSVLFPAGLHVPFWVIVPLAASVAACLGNNTDVNIAEICCVSSFGTRDNKYLSSLP